MSNFNLNRPSSPGGPERTDKIRPNPTILEELTYGQYYRKTKHFEASKQVVETARPPIQSCKICKTKKLRCTTPLFLNKGSSSRKTRNFKTPKVSLLDRKAMSQKKYMEFLSTPIVRVQPEITKKKKRSCTTLKPCPPRLIQLSVPNKRVVYENWTLYHKMLPPDAIMRYKEILDCRNNNDTEEANFFFKQMDQKRRRERIRDKRKRQKMVEADLAEKNWVYKEIRQLAENIVEYFTDEPVYQLNYKQRLLSNAIMEFLAVTEVIQFPFSKDDNYYEEGLHEVTGKLAVWIDAVTKYVEINPLDDEDETSSTIEETEDEEDEEEEDEEMTDETPIIYAASSGAEDLDYPDMPTSPSSFDEEEGEL